MKTRDIDNIIAAWVRLADAQGNTEHGSHRYTGRTFPAAFPVLTAGEIRERLGRQWKHTAGNLLDLARRVESWKPTDTARGVAREFYLSSLDADLVAALGAQPTVSRTIDKAIALGMLTETRAAYSHHNDNAHPKAYTYNPNAAALLAAVMDAKMNTIKGQPQIFDGPAKMNTNRERDIETRLFSPLESSSNLFKGNSRDCQNLGAGKGFQGASGAFKGSQNIDAGKAFDGASKGLAGVELDKLPSGLDKGQQGGIQGFQEATPRPWKFGTHLNRAATDAEIVKGLSVSYPWLQEYQDRAARLNATLPPIFQMTFTPKIKRGKAGKVSKVGIRCHSPFCATLRGAFREAVLRDLGFSSVYAYDTKSSIYRISYLLNTGKWIANDIDFYELMKPRECYLDRSTYKSLAQRLYFCHSAAEVFNALKPRPADPQGLLDRATMERAARLCYGKETEQAIRARLEVYWAAMRAIVNSYRSEIFFHESCLYLDLLEALTARGYKVGQVYDGFYCDRPDIEAACLSLLPKIAKNYLEKTGMQTQPEPLAMRMKFEAPANAVESPVKPLDAPKVDNDTPTACKGQQDTAKGQQDTPTPARIDKGQDKELDEFLAALFGGGDEAPKETPPRPNVSPVNPQAVQSLIDGLPAWLDGVDDTPRPVKHDKALGLTLEDLLADDDTAREA